MKAKNYANLIFTVYYSFTPPVLLEFQSMQSTQYCYSITKLTFQIYYIFTL